MSDDNTETESTASSERHCSDREFISMLLSLYQEAPELWKVKSKDYFDKNKKALAITKITKALKVLDKNFTEEDLKRKINKLRTSFNRELKKKRDSIKSGSGADEVYIPKLWYFNEMNFLLDSTDVAATQSSVDLQGSSEDTDYHHSEIGSKKQKKKKPDDVQVELLNLATSYFSNKEEDECDVMGKTWAIQLRQLRADQKIFARKIINDVLFEGAMGTLTRRGVSFLPDVASGSPVNISNNYSYSSDSTYDSPILPQTPVPRTYSTPNNPPIYSSSSETSQSPIRHQSPDLSKNTCTLLPVDLHFQQPQYQLQINNDYTSSSERSPATNTPSIGQSQMAKKSSALDKKSTIILPYRFKRYIPWKSSTRTSSHKNSSTSPRSTILRKSIEERYTLALNNESPKDSSSCQLNEDFTSTDNENDLIRPEELNLTSDNRFSTMHNVEETYTAAEYLNNYSSF